MPIIIQMRDNVIKATFRGKLFGEDFRQVARELRDIEARLDVSPDRISDLSEGDLSELAASDIVAFADNRAFANLKNKVKSAIIAPDPVQFGIARMCMGHNRNPDIEMQVFKDKAKAYEWIGLEPKPDDKSEA